LANYLDIYPNINVREYNNDPESPLTE